MGPAEADANAIDAVELDHWRRLIDSGALQRRLEAFYWSSERVGERLGVVSELLRQVEKQFGSEGPVSVIRVPGRLNTLGRHIDHRGGTVNPIALEQDVLLAFRPSQDDTIEVADLAPQFGSRSLRIEAELPPQPLSDADAWLAWTQKLTEERRRQGTHDDWIQKLRAAPVYLAAMVYPDRGLRGFRGVLSSNIPSGAGLGSSSALVVAFFEAMAAANGLEMSEAEFITHCGSAEWYVGTRGGCGDHAAIKLGKRGMITHVKTVPQLRLVGYSRLPEGFEIVVFGTGIEADKTGAAGAVFKERIATYELGEIYMRRYLEETHGERYRRIIQARSKVSGRKFFLADAVEILPEQEIYEMLATVPERIDRAGLLAQLPDCAEQLRRAFATHPEPDHYTPQQVLLYGLAESARGKILSDVLDAGNVQGFGALMLLSHNGDRVTGLHKDLARLKDALDRGVSLYEQPGDYGCSLPEIDEMVDLACRAGALGAQLCGAGLGGSIIALCERSSARRVIDTMTAYYDEPRGIKPFYLEARPSAGATLL